MKSRTIPLFYWSEIKFIFREKENYGDLLSKYLVEKISGKIVKWVHPKKQPWYKLNKRNYLAVGSIIHHANKNSIVWGSGIIDTKQHIIPAKFLAVRGPRTREHLLNLGYSCPPVYGDPALLLPKYFYPEVQKIYKLGIVPHYNDYEDVAEIYKNEKDVIVIDMMTMEVEKITTMILQCEKIISSSLHGVIVSHAYQLPAIWVKFSDKIFGDGIKYVDYLESVDISLYDPPFLDKKEDVSKLISMVDQFPNTIESEVLKKTQQALLKSCPFIKREEV